MSLIFTHADLKGVNDYFHDKKEGSSRKDFNGNIRSFGEAADFYSQQIKKYIEELKLSQPLLPVTKIPSASIINQAIEYINEDGSTNIKGVYKNKQNLIIIKYNELQNEDLEKIGFPKGSIIQGIETISEDNEKINTGNIHFIVHGLDYSNQLINFDALNTIDSDVLLSVSYAERPESKYRFFIPQGILLDCKTKYIHGGGQTDSGSGCEKNITEFKKNYIFGAKRESDRNYISDLIKQTLNLNDQEYIQFIKENENKSFLEIQPIEIRNQLIKAFSKINSKTRYHGNRAYNEMYISNPELPMAVFAYPMDDNEQKNNPIEFLESQYVKQRTDFLQSYALERDLPFIVFGE